MEGMMHEEAVLSKCQINQLFCDFLISGLEI